MHNGILHIKSEYMHRTEGIICMLSPFEMGFWPFKYILKKSLS